MFNYLNEFYRNYKKIFRVEGMSPREYGELKKKRRKRKR